MSKVVKIFAIIAAVAIVIFAPYIAPAIGGFLGASGFLAVAIGSIVIAVGLTLLQAVFTPSGQGAPMEAGKVTLRIGEAPRWINAGIARQGGAVVFADFDSAGNFWCVVIHSDSIRTTAPQYHLDDIPVTLSAGGDVLNPEFRLASTKGKEPVTTSGAGTAYINIQTTTYTETNPVPPAIAALATAFGAVWSADHKLVGTTYSVMRCAALPIEHRAKIYKWRGPCGVGEPALTLTAQWSNMYDPRDVTQTLGTRSTYKPSRNPVLIWAWYRTHPFGRKKPESSINWTMVGAQATICDAAITGLNGTAPRYECGIAIPDNKQRIIAEQEIMLSMDAQIVFDDDGKTWVRAGSWVAPTLALTRNRDIVAMESVEAQNGESETQGVIVRYVNPEANYAVTPAAAWINPLYYVVGETPTFLTIDILGCQNHNQAMRLAKAIGYRSQSSHKIVPSVSLRGLRARKERIINLTYDNTFAGDYEIVTPVEIDSAGVFCGFGAVPVDADRWTLLAGEEKPKPVITDASGPGAPAGLTTFTPDYTGGTISATFVKPATRSDTGVQVQYATTADAAADYWKDMDVNLESGVAESGVITSTDTYAVRHRTFSASGVPSAWTTVGDTATTAYSESLILTIFQSWIVEVAAGTDVVSIASTGTLTISNHTRRYLDGHADVSVTGATINTGLAAGAVRFIGYDDGTRVGGAVTFNLYADENDAHASTTNPNRHYVGFFEVPASGSSGGGGGGIPN